MKKYLVNINFFNVLLDILFIVFLLSFVYCFYNIFLFLGGVILSDFAMITSYFCSIYCFLFITLYKY